MIRVVNQLQEAKVMKEYSVGVFMDFESCFEKVWRAGLLFKAIKIGISGRMLIYLHNYITDRKYYLKINKETSEWQTSKVGIPQGSVLSPLLCNLYTSDAMAEVKSKLHSEFADDNTVLSHGTNVSEVADEVIEDCNQIINTWCPKWNMQIAPEKTQAMVISPPNVNKPTLNLKIKDKNIEQVDHKKVLGIILDEKLDFSLHIQERKNKGFKALKGIEHFINSNSGCSQDTFLRYRSLVLPTMDYGVAALATATDKASKEFGQVQRAALLKATRCFSNSSTEAVEVLSSCIPIHLHIKLRQAEELLRIYSKHDVQPIKEEFLKCMTNSTLRGKKTTYNMLLSTFCEMKGKFSLENVAKEFEYTKESMCLCRKSTSKCEWKELQLDKSTQEENIKEILGKLSSDNVIAFTDGSALGNPGPARAEAAIYYKRLEQVPVCLSKPVCSNGNNYIGELVGIQIALQNLCDQQNLQRNIHFFVDCQPAIISAFGSDAPKNKVDMIFHIRHMIASLESRGYSLYVHWIPGHRDFKGNELADTLAKKAAKEMQGKKEDFYDGVADTSELIKLMKKGSREKWQTIYENSQKTDILQEIISEVGKNQQNTGDIAVESTINQIISGQVALNYITSKIDSTKSDKCEVCNEKETIQHYIFVCQKYKLDRSILERDIEEILARNDIKIPVINLKTLTGNLEEVNGNINFELRNAFGKFLRSTGRLIKSH